MKIPRCLLLSWLVVSASLGTSAQESPVPASAVAGSGDLAPVVIRVEAGKPGEALTPIWRFFGYDEPNFTYMKDGKKLLSEIGKLGGPQVYVRCHHLLTSGDGSPALKWGSTGAYTEDAEGKPVYDWTITDRIFDTYLERGLKPYVQIGFMPEAMSTHPENYPHHPPFDQLAPADAGQAYPPKDYVKWGELSYQWAKHCVEKYGQAEVEAWYWEVWNEPNIMYWHGSVEDYCKLYDYAVEGVRRAVPRARVGGPETAGGPGGKFLGAFLEHCAHGTNFVTGQPGVPLDFISFHAKGSPKFVDGHVRMAMSSQLTNMDQAFAVVAGFPEFRKLPLVIGESDPEGCAACRGPQNGYRNGTMYSSYTAASFARARELATLRGVNLEGALTWAFEFENQPFFAGFRALASNGLDLPVLNVFRMMAKMGGRRLPVESGGAATLSAREIMAKNVRGEPDIAAVASLEEKKLSVLAWYYHDDDVPGPERTVEVALEGLPSEAMAGGGAGGMRMKCYRVDADHGNSYDAWKRMGSPAAPTAEQYAELERAGQLTEAEALEVVKGEGGKAVVRVRLPRQGVVLLVGSW